MKESQLDKLSPDQSVKSFFKFVNQLPQFQNAVFLFSKTYNLNPNKFLDGYQFKQIKTTEGIVLQFAQFQNQDTKQRSCIFNINYQFTGDNKKLGQRQKTLILMYLLKKAKNCKIILCFDKQSIQRINSQQITSSLSLIFEYFTAQQHKDLKQSIGILINYDQQNLNQQKEEKILQMLFKPLQIQANDLFKNNILETIQIIKILKNKKRTFIYNENYFKDKQKCKQELQVFLEKLFWFSPNKIINLKFISSLKMLFEELYHKKGDKGFHNLFYNFNEYFQQSIAQNVYKYFKLKNNNIKNSILKQNKEKNQLFKFKNLIDKYKFTQLKFKDIQQNNNKWSQLNKVLVFFFRLFDKRQTQIEDLQDYLILQLNYQNFLSFVIFLYKLEIFNDFKVLEELLLYKNIYDAFLLTQNQFQILNSFILPIQEHQQTLQKIDIYQKIFFIVIKQYLSALQQQISKAAKNISKNFSIQVQNIQRILVYCGQPFFKQMTQKQLIPSRFQYKLQKAIEIFKIKQIECMQDPLEKIRSIFILHDQAFQNNQQYFLQIIGDLLVVLFNQNQYQSKQIQADLAKLAIECYEISNTPSSINKTATTYQEYLGLDRIMLFKHQKQYKQRAQTIQKYLQYLISMGKVQKARQISLTLFSLDQRAFKRILLLCTKNTSEKLNLKFMKLMNEFNPKAKNIVQLKQNIQKTIDRF